MADNIVTVLDTTVGETGPDENADFVYLKKEIRGDADGSRFNVTVASGDTLIIEGKTEASEVSYSQLQEITASGVYDVKLLPVWRARRSVDGAAGDSVVKLVNLYNGDFTEHA